MSWLDHGFLWFTWRGWIYYTQLAVLTIVGAAMCSVSFLMFAGAIARLYHP